MNLERRVIEGRARGIVLNVTRYFEQERDSCKKLLHKLRSILLEAQNEGVDNVKFSTRMLAKIVTHFKKTATVTSRVVEATQINKNTLTRIRREGEISKESKLSTPVKKPRGKIKYFDETGLVKLRDILHSIFIEQKEPFLLRKCLTIVQHRLNYKGSLSTLRRIVADLGYQICRSESKRIYYLTEKGNNPAEKHNINFEDGGEYNNVLQESDDSASTDAFEDRSLNEIKNSNLRDRDFMYTENSLNSSESMNEEYLEEFDEILETNVHDSNKQL